MVDAVVNPYDVGLSDTVKTVLKRGPKYCVNVKPSRVDISACVQTIAGAIPDVTAKPRFLDVSGARMCKILEGSFGVDTRNFKKFQSIERGMTAKFLVLLETDEMSRFAVLPTDQPP